MRLSPLQNSIILGVGAGILAATRILPLLNQPTPLVLNASFGGFTLLDASAIAVVWGLIQLWNKNVA